MELSALLRSLEKKYRVLISMEIRHEAFWRFPELKLLPDQYLHHSPHCRARKLADNNRKCAANKRRSLQIAAKGRAFCGVCPAGVRELVQPVMFQGKLAAAAYFSLPEDNPPMRELFRAGRFLAEFTSLELERLTEGKVFRKQNGADFYLQRFQHYLDLHYSENIGLSELAEELKVNPNYLGELLHRHTGKTFREALTERRLHEAKIYLLLHRQLSITAVSHLCGFSDSNYFSSVFRRHCGMTPGEYRRQNIH